MSAFVPSENVARAERILEAAARLTAYYGYDKTTVSDIAREAGVSKGAIYLHWRSRDELFDALVKHEMDRTLDDFLARVEADPQGGTIFGIYRHALLALAANPLLRALYTRDCRVLGDYVRRRDPAIYRERFLFSREFIAALQSAGLVRRDLRAEVVNYILSVITVGFIGIDALIGVDQAPPLEEVGDALADMVRRALEPEAVGDPTVGRRAVERMLAQLKEQRSKEVRT